MKYTGTETNRLYNVDCMEFMAGLPDNYYDLAIVDPPYGIKLKGQNIIKNKSDTKDFNTEWDAEIPEKKYFTEIIRVSQKQIIWGGNYFLDFLGFCKAPIIWDKLNGASLYADGELAWTGGKVKGNLGIFRHQWCGAFKDSERKVINIHPTQKPIALYDWCIKREAKPGNRLLDTHSGSGSFRIAAHDLGFTLDSCELYKDYCIANEERFQRHIEQVSLFSGEDIQESVYNQEELF